MALHNLIHSGVVLAAGLGVILPIVAVVVTISGVMLFIDRRHKQREQVLKELQYIHNVNDKNGKLEKHDGIITITNTH